MRKNLKVLFVTILMMVTGASLSYAAFPIQPSAVTTSSASGSETPTVSQSADHATVTTAKPAKHADGAHGGKSQIAAALLCFFLGGLGIHRFYLGYTWQGIVQLLTGGGCGIWALIDFIRILTGDLGPKNGRYAKTF